jgi:uncharacterized protein YndB with AHSA1/START domain
MSDPSDFDPGPLADVTWRPAGDRATLTFVREVRHAPERVWAALTDPAQLPQWAPFTPTRSLAAAGSDVSLRTDGDPPMDLPCTVLVSEPPTRLDYTWGDDLLSWRLTRTAAGGTRLTLHHTVGSTDWMPRVAAGWHLCLVVMERLLDGAPIGPIVGASARAYGWERLHDAYAATLGVEGGGWPEGM